nr:hypothetical protein [Kibdelosporangium sp. MJ126-NF4]CEL17625.1 hypothetical protein [Kibdelosporangium sp. MJ126-NF4]CTQ91147.1 hypothetical protein [Kibdelosporangium sp. MJ126-NF4]
MAQTRDIRHIEVFDFGGRPRTLDVIAVPKFVVIKVPAGESAYLSFSVVEPFRDAVLNAMVKASRLT